MELSYRQSGDYLLPNVTLETTATQPMGKYGRMRKAFLKEHRKGTYNTLLLTGELTAHLLMIDRTVREQVEATVAKMAKAEGVTEELKARDQMKWTGLMNNLTNAAEELILADLIYS